METRDIFPHIQDARTRNAMLSRLVQVSGRIPSLHSFLEDTKYLEPCATIMRALIPSKTNHSIYRSLADCSAAALGGRVQVEVQRGVWQEIQTGVRLTTRLAYLQLWLYCMRNCVRARKNAGRPKPESDFNQHWRPLLGQLAARVGYDSAEVRKLKENDPFEKAVRAFVLNTGIDGLEVNEVDQPVQDICNILQGISRSDLQVDDMPQVVSDEIEEPLSHRCGRPFDLSHQKDRPYMYLKFMCGPVTRENGRYLSSFGVKRDIFYAFFGKINIDYDAVQHNGPPDDGPRSTHVGTVEPALPRTHDYTSNSRPQRHSSNPPTLTAQSTVWSDYLCPHELGSLRDLPIEGYKIQHTILEPAQWRRWLLRNTTDSLPPVYFDPVNELIYCIPPSIDDVDERCVFVRLRCGHAIYVIEDDTFTCITEVQHVLRSQFRMLVEKGTRRFTTDQTATLRNLCEVYYPGQNVDAWLGRLGHTNLNSQ